MCVRKQRRRASHIDHIISNVCNSQIEGKCALHCRFKIFFFSFSDSKMAFLMTTSCDRVVLPRQRNPRTGGMSTGCWLPFLGIVMTKDWAIGVGHSPVCQILVQIVVRAVITSSPPAWTSSAGMLSTHADFLFFSDCTAASTSLRKMGWSSSVSVWGQSSTDRSSSAL